jgi:hypothetical protein
MSDYRQVKRRPREDWRDAHSTRDGRFQWAERLLSPTKLIGRSRQLAGQVENAFNVIGLRKQIEQMGPLDLESQSYQHSQVTSQR